VDDDNNNLPNQSLHLEDDFDEDEELLSIIDHMLDPTNPEISNTADDKIIPASAQNKFSGVLDQLDPWQCLTTKIYKMNGKIY
jgi:hypothetical protein